MAKVYLGPTFMKKRSLLSKQKLLLVSPNLWRKLKIALPKPRVVIFLSYSKLRIQAGSQQHPRKGYRNADGLQAQENLLPDS